MTLELRPETEERTRSSLFGTVDATTETRRALFRLTSQLSRSQPLRVALYADERDSWSWADGWTEAMDVVAGTYEVRLVKPGGVRGRR